MMTIEMDVALGEGTRRLPIYLLLDCSYSMTGAPIQSVQLGVETFVRETTSDPSAQETVHVGVITFGGEAKKIDDGLVPIDDFTPPTLTANGGTPLGGALIELQRSLDRDLKPNIVGQERGDWKPLVFILTDGEPTDDWENPRQQILDRQKNGVVNVITVGCGPGINDENLKKIAIGPRFNMDNNERSFREFFKWMTQSIKSVSRSVSNPANQDQPVNLPPSPQVIQFIP